MLTDKDQPEQVINNIRTTLMAVQLDFLERELKVDITATLMTTNQEKVMKITENEECNSRMFEGYKELIMEQIKTQVTEKIQNKEGEDLLSMLASKWDNLKIITQVLTRVFRQLDRFYVRNRNTGTLTQIAFNLFREQIFDNHKHKLTQTFLNQIDKCRVGHRINKVWMKQVLNCQAQMGQVVKDIEKKQIGVFKFESLDIKGDEDLHYQLEFFEKEFIKHTNDQQKAQSLQKLQAEDVPSYIKQCLEKIHEEEQRSDDYLHPTTKKKLIHEVTSRLIVDHLKEITENQVSGCENMFKNKQLDQLKEMQTAFAQQPSLTMKQITQHFEPQIVERGKLLISDVNLSKKPVQMVDKLMDFKDEIDTIVNQSFAGYNEFQQCRMKAFQKFMNQSDSPTVWIAQWCNDFMVNTCKSMDSKSVNQMLDKVIDLFLRTDGRDQFIIKQSELLCKRLINNESANDTQEESMISKLKQHVGQASVGKLITMKGDMELSKKLWDNFKDSGEDLKDAQELDVRVLTMSQWPIKNQDEVILNSILSNRILKFTSQYKKKHEGRKITQCPNQGDVELKMLFTEKSYIMKVTCLMACVLLLFKNKEDKLTFKEILEALASEVSEDLKDELESNILGMCNPKKALILLKDFKDKPTVELREGFKVNTDFNYKLLRFSCEPMGTKKKMDKEKQVLNSNIKNERQMILDAKLVKVFKARRTITETELVGEIMKMKFMWKPTQLEVLQRLGNLIDDKEWVARDEKDPKTQHYIA